jgi:hypothetical protein
MLLNNRKKNDDRIMGLEELRHNSRRILRRGRPDAVASDLVLLLLLLLYYRNLPTKWIVPPPPPQSSPDSPQKVGVRWWVVLVAAHFIGPAAHFSGGGWGRGTG